MNTPGTAASFQTTSWTLVLRAPTGGEALEELLMQYRWPLYAFLRRKGFSESDAEDLTQTFICDVLLDGEFLGRAEKGRGRFRSFLVRSLENFIVDEYRRRHGRDPAARRKVVTTADPTLLLAAEPSEEDDPHRAFDRQWATTVFNLALSRVEALCKSNGMTRQWTAFEEKILRPAKFGTERTPTEELMTRLGAQRPQQVHSMLQTIKRKIDDAMREVVAETVDDPNEVEAELAELRSYLAS